MPKLFNSFAQASEQINEVSDLLSLPPEERGRRDGERAVSAIERALIPGLRLTPDIIPNINRVTVLANGVKFTPNSRIGTRAPEPDFDESGLGMRLGTLKLPGVQEPAMRVGSRTFVLDRKPIALDFFAPLYTLTLFTAEEWLRERPRAFPGWRSLSNRIFNQMQETVQSGIRYRFGSRI